MKHRRTIGSLAAVLAISAAIFLYTAHPVKSSDHQDTFNLAHRSNTSADITDMYVFPSPANASNVVLVMNVSPLIPAGQGTSKFFDPSVMWQFKIAHGAVGTFNSEDEVIQITVSGTDASQTFTLHGPGKPNQVGTTNTLLPATGTFSYNNTSGQTLSNGILAFAGPRADPFFFDLFQFFNFLGDRNYSNHTSQSDPGTGDTLTNPMPTFNGFASGTLSGTGGYACSTAPASNALTQAAPPGFNVLSYVIEVPRSLLTSGYSSSTIHVWATASSVSGS
ncbi:MAG TPA: DUF4331 family protein [Candidatus Baltobacteraceae bacterium]|nr:DUF4331 family protein [Candidatus Baltobacteraceae bacterium]